MTTPQVHLFRCTATYATEHGAQGRAEFTIHAQTLQDAELQARCKIIRDGRRRCAGKIDIATVRLTP